MLLLLAACSPCPEGTTAVGAGCAADSALEGGGSETVVLAFEGFGGDSPGWSLDEGTSGGAECGVVDGAYTLQERAPNPDRVDVCWMRRDQPLDLSGYTTATLYLDYDFSHYKDAAGPADLASVAFETVDGSVKDDQILRFGEGEEPPPMGAVALPLDDFVGWSAATLFSIRLALHACPDPAQAGCGVDGTEVIAWVAVDEFRVEAE